MNNTIKKLSNGDFEIEDNEKCIVCKEETDVLKSMYVDYRKNYVDWSGQLCDKCAIKIQEK